MNSLFFGDNLQVLREHVKDESVDLVYLDPPFNSNANYNVLFKSPKGEQSHAQIEAFEDTWHWGEQAESEFSELVASTSTEVAEVMVALRKLLGDNDMSAYLTMMANRLIELRRVLKPTGSLYLHCDSTASHYLKIILDGVFGLANFKNEIVWERTGAKAHASTRYSTSHDIIFFYTASSQATWHSQFLPHRPEYIASHYSNFDQETGRRYTLDNLLNPNPDRPNLRYEFPPGSGNVRVWRWTQDRMLEAFKAGRIYVPESGGMPRYKRYLDEMAGTPITSVWTDIPPLNSQAQERLGYPTQKPLALLERIINSSSNKGDVILDPFCGCGTAVHAAEKLEREWIGIDITHLAITLIEKRMRDAFPALQFSVVGTPKDAEGARNLAQRDKYQFQWWACSLVDAQPWQGKKKGADSGIDGIRFFQDEPKKTKKVIVSVKGGENVSVAMIRDLKGVLEREKAEIGLFVSLIAPTKPMVTEAASAGFYVSPLTQKKYPRIQILTVGELVEGKVRAQYPELGADSLNFKKAELVGDKRKQTALFGE